ncbi:MAG: hypothetical protein PHR45_06690 [Muribaculaceae bacterium]|nr:hypothetical protein [Muribaculaceae bacterium]
MKRLLLILFITFSFVNISAQMQETSSVVAEQETTIYITPNDWNVNISAIYAFSHDEEEVGIEAIYNKRFFKRFYFGGGIKGGINIEDFRDGYKYHGNNILLSEFANARYYFPLDDKFILFVNANLGLSELIQEHNYGNKHTNILFYADLSLGLQFKKFTLSLGAELLPYYRPSYSYYYNDSVDYIENQVGGIVKVGYSF